MKRQFKLLKDLPGVAAGAIFKKKLFRDYICKDKKFLKSEIVGKWYVCWTYEVVDNPEWFEEQFIVDAT